MVAVIAAAFPGTPRRRIAADTEALLTSLAGRGLVIAGER